MQLAGLFLSAMILYFRTFMATVMLMHLFSLIYVHCMTEGFMWKQSLLLKFWGIFNIFHLI